jgi:hypothetical protein
MEQALKRVKDFSPYGWGVTVLILALDMYNSRNPITTNHTSLEIEALKTRIAVVEVESRSMRESTNAVLIELKTVKQELVSLQKIGCAPLTREQRQVLATCGE